MPSTTVLAERAGDVLSLRMGRTVAGLVRKCVPDERVAQMIDHFTQYVGSAPTLRRPFSAASPTCRPSEGIWYPDGRYASCPRSTDRLGTELGVEYRTEAAVDAIEIDRDRVTGVQLQSGRAVGSRRRGLQFRFGADASGVDRRDGGAEFHESPQL